ncbi:MAG: phosphoenolpyruvate--protein phosphotransferase [Pseudomonadota bacterium]
MKTKPPSNESRSTRKSGGKTTPRLSQTPHLSASNDDSALESNDKSKQTQRGDAQTQFVRDPLNGLGVSSGIAIGPAFLLDTDFVQLPERALSPDEIEGEVNRLSNAVAKAKRQISKLRTKARRLPNEASTEVQTLLDAHGQMLSGSRLVRDAERRVTEELLNAENAMHQAALVICATFEEMGDPYLASRARDVMEVARRVIRNLTDQVYSGFRHVPPGSILVAGEITPADTALMTPDTIHGFVASVGGPEGHTAIMARSLGIPAVLGIPDLRQHINPGDLIILDGETGRVFVNPDASTRAHFDDRITALRARQETLNRLRDLPPVTRDGAHINLLANVELPIEVEHAITQGAQGIGLLRTEFQFMNREDIPNEAEQFETLKSIVVGMAGRPVTIRTLDLGGEKLAPSIQGNLAASANPALGVRAIRLSLAVPTLLDTQLQAILRAAAFGPVRILLPMISTVDEIRQVRDAVRRAAQRLKRRKIKIPDPLPPVGIMIEIPGAALAADALAKESDFFAIGTNDLTMYTLAIDRADEQVAHLYNPMHPAVLRLIQFAVSAALRARIPISVCGEIAGEPRFADFLVGLGVRELSMSSTHIPLVKQKIRSMDLSTASRRAERVMEETEQDRIAELLSD